MLPNTKLYNRAFLNGKTYDVISENEFMTEPFDSYTDMAIIIENRWIIPIRHKNSIGYGNVGYYPNYPFSKIILPRTPEEEEMYSINKLVMFNNIETFEKLIDNKMKLKQDEIKYMSGTAENAFLPYPNDQLDSPQMWGLKAAVCYKNTDINYYGPRFGDDFNNDKRKFSGNDITFKKLVAIADNLDIKLTLSFEDKDGDIPNPMRKKIIVVLNPSIYTPPKFEMDNKTNSEDSEGE